MILHLAPGETWRAALMRGTYESPPFVHCSTGRQVRVPWRTLYATTDDLILLLIDESTIGAPVRYEAAVAGEEAFPHVYGPIPVPAVVAAEPIEPWMASALALPPRITRLLVAARGESPPGVDEWRHLGIPRDVVETALSNSLCFGLYSPAGDQAGFCRVVTDRATYGYLADAFVLPGHRELGLGLWLVQCAVEHPELAGLRSWQLGTRDAHGIYERLGWRAADPARWMARTVAPSDIYGPGL